MFHVVDEVSGQPVQNPLQAVQQSGSKATLGDRILLMNKNGKSLPIDQTVAAIRQPDGTLAGVVVVFRDVAEQRKNAQTRASRYAERVPGVRRTADIFRAADGEIARAPSDLKIA